MYHSFFKTGQKVRILYGIVYKTAEYVKWTGDRHLVKFLDGSEQTYLCGENEIKAVELNEK